MLYRSEYRAPIGNMTLVCDETALIGLWLAGQKHFFAGIDEPVVLQETEILLRAKDWLDRYFLGEMPVGSEIPLNPRGTAFQKRVWQLLQEIPYGNVCTYGQLAGKLVSKSGSAKPSARAVGGAVGRNPILIMIPCHRVIGADGRLTGYAGGMENKQWLLHHEGEDRR